MPDRRTFLAAAASLAAAPRLARAADAGGAAPPKIKLGVIGTGGRGAWIADLFAQHGGYTIHALADYFADRVNPAGEKLGVPESRRFTGLGGYRKLLESAADGGVDAVAIMSPPYFHPEHAAAAVDAGKHVFLAKPIAVDVPGCRSVEQSATAATAKGRVFLVDFQTRADPHFIEVMNRVAAGALGERTFGEAIYHAGRLNPKGAVDGSPESRLRNWVFDVKLSGDVIVEQHIHTLDVMNWIMGDTPPLDASATCGRKVRTDVGDANDHYTALYRYADPSGRSSGGVGVTFSSRQCEGFGSQPDGIRNRMFGSAGVVETQYGGMVLLRGDEKRFYKGLTQQIYQSGVVANIASFAEAIAAGRYDNPTVKPSVTSNLVALLGRTAAYAGRTVAWADFVKSTDRMEPDLSGLNA